jgi:phosphatidylglycerol lysyltransferase
MTAEPARSEARPAPPGEPTAPGASDPPPAEPRSYRRWLAPLLGLALLGVAAWVLHRELAGLRYDDIAAATDQVAPRSWALAGLLTAVNFAVMTGYDALALAYIGRSVALRRVALAAFVANAFMNGIGQSVLTAGSVRYRLYTGWGLSAFDVTRVVFFCFATFWLGVLLVGGTALLVAPGDLPLPPQIPDGAMRVLGAAFLVVPLAYVAWSLAGRQPLKLRGWTVERPAPALVARQLAVAVVDWLAAGAVLYVLLPEGHAPQFLVFEAVFVTAHLVGVLSQSPGGLGVFETVVVVALRGTTDRASLLAILLVYRLIYYVAPLALAATALGVRELNRKADRVARAAAAIGARLSPLVPQVLAFLVFLGGAVLLISGATPGEEDRLLWLRPLLPLGVLEASHFAGSLFGAVLLLVARGLQLRIDGAWYVTVGLLLAGAVASLLKGFDYEEAVVLTGILAVVIACRREFHRRASVLREPFTVKWLVAIGAVLVATEWLGFFAYRHVEYDHELWWRFAWHGDAPRFLRAQVGVMGALLAFGVARLLSPGQPRPARPTPDVLDRAAAIAAGCDESTAALAFLADKSLLFHPTADAFLMYAIRGRTWVAMGDPVGPPGPTAELVWQFLNLAHRHGGRVAFYEVHRRRLDLYLDAGLTLLKLGEEARVPLRDFTLEGGDRKSLRQTRRRAEKAGCAFEVVQPEAVPALIPELRRVSDAWLARLSTREKGFSLGWFDPTYLARFPCAVVRLAGRVVAFTNLWPGNGRFELSCDLMRQDDDAPPGVMDYLFTEVMLWGRERGYEWFNMGMAPLSGLERGDPSPLWNRLGSWVFRHGESFYNFQGLRQFKEKFDPVWEPRYLACRGGLGLPALLTDVAALINTPPRRPGLPQPSPD